MKALYDTDENLLTVALKISLGFNCSVFLKFGETFFAWILQEQFKWL